jgi:hypothetical protein
MRSRLLQVFMSRGGGEARKCDPDADAAGCECARSCSSNAAARAWGAFAALAYDEGDNFCRRLSPFHIALRSHSASASSSSWLICPSSWVALTLMMRTWALDTPVTRSMLCHAAWSPAFDILLPPSSAVFTTAAASAAGVEDADNGSHVAAYQLAVAMRQRRVFFEAYILHRFFFLPVSVSISLPFPYLSKMYFSPPLNPFFTNCSPAAAARDSLARLMKYERKSRHMRSNEGTSSSQGMLMHIARLLDRA